MNDSDYMKIALEAAKQGIGWVNPNPMVGAVIVKDNAIIASGYHKKYGCWHAERNALSNCPVPPQGGTMFVTLEPCCHYGKTPPCTEAIIRSKIARVVIGTLDPNPLMAGKGAAILRNAGIQVDVGLAEEECKELNRMYRKFITSKKPYVTMKYAMTMDGKIAAYNASKWITNEASRLNVQKSRQEYTAVMAGVNTVIWDDPLLTCRMKNSKKNIRIICDTHLRTPLSSQIVRTACDYETLIATASEDTFRKELYTQKGCTVLNVRRKGNHIDLSNLMTILGHRGIDSVLLEGGSALNWSALEQQIVDSVQAYIAPKIFGGSQAKTPVGGTGVEFPRGAFRLRNTKIRQFDSDYFIESEVAYPCLQES